MDPLDHCNTTALISRLIFFKETKEPYNQSVFSSYSNKKPFKRMKIQTITVAQNKRPPELRKFTGLAPELQEPRP